MDASSAERFDWHLADGFESLATKGDGYMSLAWIQQALMFLSQTHGELMSLVPDLKQALQGQDANWLRACVRDIDRLLEVCEVLIKSIADIRYYQMFVQLAIQSVQSKQAKRAQHLLYNCIHALSLADNEETSRLSLQRLNLEKCVSTLISIWDADNLDLPNGGDDSIILPAGLVYGTRCASVFILLVVAAGLTVRPRLSSSRQPSRSKPGEGRHAQPLWLDPLVRLFESIKNEIINRSEKKQVQPFSFLCELDEVDASVRHLHSLIQDKEFADRNAVKDCIQTLKINVDQVELRLPLIEADVIAMRKILTSSRTIILQLLHTGQIKVKKIGR